MPGFGGLFGTGITLENVRSLLRLSVDLPINFTQPVTGDVGTGMNFAMPDSTITGTVNGSNRVFTLTDKPLDGAALIFSDNVLVPPAEYTITGATLTFDVGSLHIPTNSILAAYRY